MFNLILIHPNIQNLKFVFIRDVIKFFSLFYSIFCYRMDFTYQQIMNVQVSRLFLHKIFCTTFLVINLILLSCNIVKVIFMSSKAAKMCADKLNQTSKMGNIMSVYVDSGGMP